MFSFDHTTKLYVNGIAATIKGKKNFGLMIGIMLLILPIQLMLVGGIFSSFLDTNFISTKEIFNFLFLALFAILFIGGLNFGLYIFWRKNKAIKLINSIIVDVGSGTIIELSKIEGIIKGINYFLSSKNYIFSDITDRNSEELGNKSRKERREYAKEIEDNRTRSWLIIINNLQGILELSKSSLVTHLENEKDILSETNKNIGKMNNNILSIQKLRLDNQIKQFEELQRVLVKV